MKQTEETQPMTSLFEILTTVCEYYNLDIFDVISKSRKVEYVRAREMFSQLSREFTKESFARIGILIALDHSTVIANVRRFEKYINQKSELKYRTEYNEIKEKLNK